MRIGSKLPRHPSLSETAFATDRHIAGRARKQALVGIELKFVRCSCGARRDGGVARDGLPLRGEARDRAALARAKAPVVALAVSTALGLIAPVALHDNGPPCGLRLGVRVHELMQRSISARYPSSISERTPDSHPGHRTRRAPRRASSSAVKRRRILCNP